MCKDEFPLLYETQTNIDTDKKEDDGGDGGNTDTPPPPPAPEEDGHATHLKALSATILLLLASLMQ